MRVLFLSRYQFPLVKSGGTGVAVYELMRELMLQGHDVEHWTWASLTDGRRVEGMVGFVPGYEHTSQAAWIKTFNDIHATSVSMIKCIEEVRPFDIVHAHTWEVYFVALVAKYLWNRPLVFTTHDVIRGDPAQELNDADFPSHSLIGEATLMREADAIIAVSDSNLAAVTKAYPEISEKICVIPNGVNTVEFCTDSVPPNALPRLVPGVRDYVLFLGRAVKSKGIEYVIDAARRISEEVPFVFALSTARWDGLAHNTSQYYLEMVEALQQDRPNVHLLKNIWDRQLVTKLYVNASVTVMPSVYEPCGMVALESQSCGTPVVATRIGYMQHAVKHRSSGILIDFHGSDDSFVDQLVSAIEEIHYDKTLRGMLSENARKLAVEVHDWSLRGREHLKLYERLQAHLTPALV